MGIKPVCVPTSGAIASAAAQIFLMLISCSKKNISCRLSLRQIVRVSACVRAASGTPERHRSLLRALVERSTKVVYAMRWGARRLWPAGESLGMRWFASKA